MIFPAEKARLGRVPPISGVTSRRNTARRLTDLSAEAFLTSIASAAEVAEADFH